MSRKLPITLGISVAIHLAALAYVNHPSDKMLPVSLGGLQAPVSLTFTTVSNPTVTTQKQQQSKPLLKEVVKSADTPTPETNPRTYSKPVLKKASPDTEKKIAQKQPEKKQITEAENQKKEQVEDTPAQEQIVQTAIKASKVEGLNADPVETSIASAIKQVLPKYPRRYRRRGVEGKTIVSLLVNEQGFVEKVDIFESSGFQQMDQAALAAAKQWVFKPTQRNGQNVKSWLNLPVSFKINRT